MELEEYLRKNDLSAREFAHIMGCAVNTVYNCIRGNGRPRKDLAKKIEEKTGGLVTMKKLRKIDGE